MTTEPLPPNDFTNGVNSMANNCKSQFEWMRNQLNNDQPVLDVLKKAEDWINEIIKQTKSPFAGKTLIEVGYLMQIAGQKKETPIHVEETPRRPL